jgi:HAD superfamily hydrolase (TIGR01509 family)
MSLQRATVMQTDTAVVFDLDGVLVDSESLWDEARRDVVERFGGTWSPTATRDMMGMSSPEWTAYLRDQLGVPLTAERISEEVVGRVDRRYDESLPLLPAAVETVRDLARVFPLGLASSSNREIIERFLDASGLRDAFRVTVSSEEVARGKPAPDVYLRASELLSVPPSHCVAVEDSTNGIRAALAAGMRVVAIPNATFPPLPEVVQRAHRVIGSLRELTVDLVRDLLAGSV